MIKTTKQTKVLIKSNNKTRVESGATFLRSVRTKLTLQSVDKDRRVRTRTFRHFVHTPRLDGNGTAAVACSGTHRSQHGNVAVSFADRWVCTHSFISSRRYWNMFDRTFIDRSKSRLCELTKQLFYSNVAGLLFPSEVGIISNINQILIGTWWASVRYSRITPKWRKSPLVKTQLLLL